MADEERFCLWLFDDERKEETNQQSIEDLNNMHRTRFASLFLCWFYLLSLFGVSSPAYGLSCVCETFAEAKGFSD